jgi:hypothetical protein
MQLDAYVGVVATHRRGSRAPGRVSRALSGYKRESATGSIGDERLSSWRSSIRRFMFSVNQPSG